MLTLQIIDTHTIAINGVRYYDEIFKTYGLGPTAEEEPDTYHQLLYRKGGVLTIRTERNLVARVIAAYTEGRAAAIKNDARNPYAVEDTVCHQAWAKGFAPCV